ncbi:MAG: DMT family transporter [Asgard group archaeon]|nr:DMT family transporter [Asgard group archaeon]
MVIIDFLGEIAAIAGAVCFGIGNVIIKSQGSKIKPIAINFIRLSFSAIFYLILLLSLRTLKETFMLDAKSGLLIVGGTLLGVITGDVIFYFSQQLIGLSRAYPIAVSYPLLTYIIEIIFKTQTYSIFRIQGVILVILGVYLVTTSTQKQTDLYIRNNSRKRIILSKDDQESNDKETKELDNLAQASRRRIILGIVLAITTAFCWAIGTILMDVGITEEISGISLNGYRLICASPAAIIIFFAGNRGKQKSQFTVKGFFLVLLAGILGNTIGGLLYVYALAYSAASTTAAISASAPLIAAPLSVIFLKEKMSLLLIMGTIITITGIWLIISQ